MSELGVRDSRRMGVKGANERHCPDDWPGTDRSEGCGRSVGVRGREGKSEGNQGKKCVRSFITFAFHRYR